MFSIFNDADTMFTVVPHGQTNSNSTRNMGRGAYDTTGTNAAGCMRQRLITRPPTCTSVEASQPGIASRLTRAAIRGCALEHAPGKFCGDERQQKARRKTSIELPSCCSLRGGQMKSVVTQFANEDCSGCSLVQPGAHRLPHSDSCSGWISGLNGRHRDMDESTFLAEPANGTPPRSLALPNLCQSG